jgi:glutaredoxin
MNVQVLGISVDHVPCLRAWAESLGEISFPLLSDFWPHGEVADRYGVLRSEGYAERALFIVDEAGVIRYIDVHDIDEQPDNRVLFEQLACLQPSPPPWIGEEKEQAGGELPQDGVVMYCNKWCPDCGKARRWFANHQVEYVEVDVVRNPIAAEQVREWADGHLVTPTFNIDGTLVFDWDEEKIAALVLKD